MSSSRLRKLCKENFLSFVRMREWHDTHEQLRGLVAEMRINEHARRHEERRPEHRRRPRAGRNGRRGREGAGVARQMDGDGATA